MQPIEVLCLYPCLDVKQQKNELLRMGRCISQAKEKHTCLFQSIGFANCLDYLVKTEAQIYIFAIDSYNQCACLEYASFVCKSYSDSTVIFYGENIIYSAELFLKKYGFIKYVIYGVIEETLSEVIDSILNNKKIESCRGIFYRSENSTIIHNPSPRFIAQPDKLPYADRSIFENSELDVMSIDTHFGCAAKCEFCEQGLNVEKSSFSPEYVMREMEYLACKYNVNRFCFTDPSILDYGKKGIQRYKHFLELLRVSDISFSINYSIRAEQINRLTIDMLSKGKQMGFHLPLVGFESACAEELTLYGKRATLTDNLQAYTLLKANNIRFSMGFIPFNPWTNHNFLRTNLTFLYRTGYARSIKSFTHRLMVFPHTSIFQKCKTDNLVNSYSFPNGYFFPDFVDERIKALYNTLINIDGEGAQIQQNDDLDGMMTWLIAEMENNSCFAEHTEVLELINEIDVMRSKQNDETYEFINSCIEASEKSNFSELEKLGNSISTKSYHNALKSKYFKLIMRKHRLRKKPLSFG